MVRRFLFTALCVLGLSVLLLSAGCGGSDLIYPGVAVFTVNGTNISPSSSDISTEGTLQIHNSSSVEKAITFSASLANATIPAESTLSMKVPNVSSLTTITITVTGGDSATLRIHP
jgi:hypothetical protein